MKEQKQNDVLNDLENANLEESYIINENASKKRNNARDWIRTVALMSCFFIAAFAIFSIPNIKKLFSPSLPTYDTPILSAYEIKDMIIFPKQNDFAGPVFSLVIFEEDSDKELVLNSIPDTEYSEIYRYKGGNATFKDMYAKNMLYAASNGKISDITEAEPTSIDGYDEAYAIDQSTFIEFYYYDSYSAEIRINQKYDKDSHTFSITFNKSSYSLDMDMSDSELEAALEPLKNDLFEIFNVSFSDVKISQSSHIRSIVYCDDPEAIQDSDRVVITLITDQRIMLTYCSPKPYFEEKNKEHIANAKLISLEDAEELLYKGYFYCCYGTSDHCPLCMSESIGRIYFDRYDHVSFEYSHRGDSEGYEYAIGIPYYVFYKEVSDEEYLKWLKGDYFNPNNAYEVTETVYVRAYVPAIEVSGYADYFASKAQLN